jgi:hypothetical protein
MKWFPLSRVLTVGVLYAYEGVPRSLARLGESRCRRSLAPLGGLGDLDEGDPSFPWMDYGSPDEGIPSLP